MATKPKDIEPTDAGAEQGGSEQDQQDSLVKINEQQKIIDALQADNARLRRNVSIAGITDDIAEDVQRRRALGVPEREAIQAARAQKEHDDALAAAMPDQFFGHVEAFMVRDSISVKEAIDKVAKSAWGKEIHGHLAKYPQQLKKLQALIKARIEAKT